MSGDRFFDQFLADYFAECDEHLALIRRSLLALETHGAPSGSDRSSAMRDLLRGLHTIKGLSGMVGRAPMEGLSHALEEVLDGTTTGAELSEEQVDALFEGVRLMEASTEAAKAGREEPDVASFVAGLKKSSPSAYSIEGARAQTPAAAAFQSGSERATGTEAEADAARARAAIQAGADVYRVEFVPTADLIGRGMGVETVRTRLRAAGEILSVTPQVAAHGVVFAFYVALPKGKTLDDAWAEDGLTWARFQHAPEPDISLPARGASAGAQVSPGHTGSGSVVRVELDRLDELMRLVGELVNSRARLDDSLRRTPFEEPGKSWESLQEINSSFARQLRDLRGAVMRVRLVPIGEVFERLRYAAREAARESGRKVRLDVEGQATELDKVVVDRMLEPLLHLVRNAVSHGIELPDTRAAIGKTEEGLLSLRASAVGDRIRIELSDDGAGIDPAKIKARARAAGMTSASGESGREWLLDMICSEGFSTRDAADLTSGRGVGMGVVRETIRDLGGELQLRTEVGKGTTFTIELPLTLMIVDALLVSVGKYDVAIPQPSLREVMQVDASSLVTYENNTILHYRGGVLPIVYLRTLFALESAGAAQVNILVVGTEAQPVGLAVDRIIGLREIVVHSINDPLVAVPGVAGATELGDGRISLILDAQALVRIAREHVAPAAVRGAHAPVSGRRTAIAGKVVE